VDSVTNPLPNPILYIGTPCAQVKLMESDVIARKDVGCMGITTQHSRRVSREGRVGGRQGSSNALEPAWPSRSRTRLLDLGHEVCGVSTPLCGCCQDTPDLRELIRRDLCTWGASHEEKGPNFW
jgi:hypothetical protein